MPTRRIVLTALAAFLLALTAFASGCGSSSSDTGVAALDNQTTTGGASSHKSSSTSTSDPQDAAIKWARCMRKNGVDVPDPQVSSDGGTIRIGPGAGAARGSFDRESTKFRAAMKTCGTPFGNARLPERSEADRAALQETMLSFAKCMRRHGVDMPDPQFGGSGGGLFQFGGRGSGIDPENPRFRAAQKACEPIIQQVRDRFGSVPKRGSN